MEAEVHIKVNGFPPPENSNNIPSSTFFDFLPFSLRPGFTSDDDS